MTREQAINYLLSSGFNENQIEEIENGLKEQKTGYWVDTENSDADGDTVYKLWKCSNCGAKFGCDGDMDFYYCPKCGVKMGVKDGKY